VFASKTKETPFPLTVSTACFLNGVNVKQLLMVLAELLWDMLVPCAVPAVDVEVMFLANLLVWWTKCPKQTIQGMPYQLYIE